MKLKAFSLIELLVVVAIISVLAALAVPIYSSYTHRAKIGQVYNLLFQQLQSLRKVYDTTGSFPNSFTYLNTSIVNYGGPTNYFPANNLGFYLMDYKYGTNYAYLDVFVSGATIGLTFNSCSQGNYALMRTGTVYTNGTFLNYCGLWLPANADCNDMPAQWVPATCTCNEMSTVFTGTPSCSPVI